MIKKFLKALSDFILGKHFERKEEKEENPVNYPITGILYTGEYGIEATVYNEARVYGYAQVYGNATVDDRNVQVRD